MITKLQGLQYVDHKHICLKGNNDQYFIYVCYKDKFSIRVTAFILLEQKERDIQYIMMPTSATWSDSNLLPNAFCSIIQIWFLDYLRE